jgi:hypothetical protein
VRPCHLYEPLHRGHGGHVVKDGEACAGTLFLDEANGPGIDRRRRRCLRDTCRHAQRRGECDQPRSIEVECLGDVGAYVIAASVAGHTENGFRSGEFEAAQLLLEYDAIAVTARQRDPRRHTAIEQQPTHDGRREVRPILVLADQNGITGPGQDGGSGCDVGRIERRAAEVGED